jgi:hypothetical protein
MLATNMTMLCVLSPVAPFTPDTRLRFYDNFLSFAADVPSSLSIYNAGLEFFSQPNHPEMLAVAQVFTASQPAQVVSGPMAVVPSMAGMTSVGFVIQAGTTPTSITSKDLHSCTTLAQIATALGTGWSVVGNSLVYTSAANGIAQIAAFATPPSGSGQMDGSALLKLTAATGATKTNGYTFVDFPTELLNIQTLAQEGGESIYAWALDAQYRDIGSGSVQDELAAYALAGERQAAFLCTNDPLTESAADQTCLAYRLMETGNTATHVFYDDNAQFYPEVSVAAIMLGVNYALKNATITAKFKDLPGVNPVNLTQTQLNAITAKQCNTFTLIGTGARTVREGVQSAASWFTDTKVNLDNFVNDLQTAIYNVFLQQPKVPYTVQGQMLLVAAAQQICQQYVSNGTFADRQIEDITAQNGYYVAPATQVNPMPIQTATAADRAARLAPPIQIVAYLAGAIHKVAVNVNVTQ